MKCLYTWVCLSAFVAAGVVASGVAVGQQAQVPAAQQPSTDAAPAAEEGALGEVLVTAQRRSENLERVPIAVTAVSQEMLDKVDVNDLLSLQVVTPGLSMSSWVGYAMTYIRGIGANFSNPGVENPIGVFVDGAYIERAKGGNLEVMDVDSVQVLKGPQSTLWGRNVTGGAILINTADPTLESTGQLNVEAGNLGRRSYDGVLNQALSDTVAVRVAARYREDGGYIRNLPDGYEFGWARNTQIRGKLLYRPNDDFSAVLQYERQDRKASQGANAQSLADVYCLLCAQSGYTHPYADPYDTAINKINGGTGIDSTNDFFNLKMKLALGAVSFESVTAYTDNYTLDVCDCDLTNIPPSAGGLHFIIPSTNKTFTQTITGTADLNERWATTFGIDYLDDKSTYELQPFVPKSNIDTTSVSPFAELTFRPGNGLSIIAGARYTSDTRDGHQVGGSVAHFSDNNVSPRFVIGYELGNVNLYASYNKGNKAGGINSPGTPLSIYLKETLASYEAGLKYLSSDHRVRASFAVFDYDYKDLQTVAIDQGSSGGPGSVRQPNAKLHGVEFDASWAATSFLDLFAGGLYESSEYKNFGNAGVQVVVYDSNGNPTGMAAGSEDLSGRSLPHAPEFSGFLGANVSGHVMSGWTGTLSAVVNYSSSYDFFPGAGGPLRFDRTPSYTTTRLSGSVKPDSGPYEVGFFVDNLTDEENIDFRFTTAPFGATQIISRPRTYGLRVSFSY